MFNKKLVFIFLSIIMVMSVGIYLYYFSLNNNEDKTMETGTVSPLEKNLAPDPSDVKVNEYFIVYIKQDNGSGSSFIPPTLNPGFTDDMDHHVSISIDDNGNIINNGGKIIEIDNFKISKDNKTMIKKIAGIEKYSDALKEIEDRVAQAKKDLDKEGLL